MSQNYVMTPSSFIVFWANLYISKLFRESKSKASSLNVQI